MNRSTVLTVVLALAAVVALSLSAATLDTATTGGGGSAIGSGPTSDSGIGSDAASDNDVGFEGEPLGGSGLHICTPWLASQGALLTILGAFALLAAVVYWKLRSLLVVASVFIVTGIPVGLIYALLTSCRSGSSKTPTSLLPFAGNGSAILPGASGATGLNQAGEALSTPSALLGLVLVVAVVGSVVALFLSTGDTVEPTPETAAEEDPSAPDVAAIGRAAGAAADRIEADADVDNEVFRAWARMTRSLDVPHPQSSTAGEFATAAVDAGLARDDVAELTALFEDVRYGGAAPTREREERALAALRRIESTYAEAGGDTPPHPGDTNESEGDR